MNPSPWFSILSVFGDVLLWDFDHSCSCAVESHFYLKALLLIRYFNFLTYLYFLLSFVPWVSPQAFAHFYEKHAVVRLIGRQIGMRTLLLLFSPCPSPSPGECSHSCLLRWWCHPTISSSVTPFSSCLQSFPASVSFLMNWLFEPGGQSTGVSPSASVLPMNIQGWFPLGLPGLTSLLSKRLSRFFPRTIVQMH